MSESPRTTAARRTTLPRAYKACLACRKRKTRCEFGGRGRPPCERCQHELRECIIPEERSWKRQATGRARCSSPAVGSSLGSPGWGAPSFVTGPPRQQQQQESTEEDVCSTPARAHASSTNLELTIIQTAVTNGNDALHLLFCGTRPGQRGAGNDSADNDDPGTLSTAEQFPSQPQQASAISSSLSAHQTSPALTNDDIKRVWSSTELGRMGWLRPYEVVSLLDSFFCNMAPFTPIISKRHHPELYDHIHMISKEHLLCAVILMISSRYNPIPGSTSFSHTLHIHSCLWRYCQKLIVALIFGQDRLAHGDGTTYGMILALLLLCEWHPRAFHFSPDADGFGGFAMHDPSSDFEAEQDLVHGKWTSQVHGAVQRSDRMSTMLVGCALTLSHELHVFDDSDERGNKKTLSSIPPQRAHVRHLAYLYTHLLADNPSFASLLPERLSHYLAENTHFGDENNSDQPVTQAWLELSELCNSFREMTPRSTARIPDDTHTRKNLSLVDHFRSSLTRWNQRHTRRPEMPSVSQRILFIEYHYAQICCSSLGMQIEVEHSTSYGQTARSPSALNGDSAALRCAPASIYAQNVNTHCCALLETILEVYDGQKLKYAPVRVFMRTIAASVFLLKSLAIGAHSDQLKSALGILDRVVQALEASAVDDIHLARHYASLVGSCLDRARLGFARLNTRQPTPRWVSPTQIANTRRSLAQVSSAPENAERDVMAETDEIPTFDFHEDHWFALPFGPEDDIFSYVSSTDGDFRSLNYSSFLNLP